MFVETSFTWYNDNCCSIRDFKICHWRSSVATSGHSFVSMKQGTVLVGTLVNNYFQILIMEIVFVSYIDIGTEVYKTLHCYIYSMYCKEMMLNVGIGPSLKQEIIGIQGWAVGRYKP